MSLKRPRDRESFDKNKRKHGGHSAIFNRPFQSIDSDDSIRHTSPAEMLESGATGLISLKLYPENSSEVYVESKKTLNKNPQLKLGIDCCMVCASIPKGGKKGDDSRECTRCFRIEYCDKNHKKKDRKAHSVVCDALCQLNKDEEYMVSIGCNGDANGFGDGTGVGGAQEILMADNVDYAFDLYQYTKDKRDDFVPGNRQFDLAMIAWKSITSLENNTLKHQHPDQTTISTLSFPLGLMHRSWDWKSLLLMPVGNSVNSHVNGPISYPHSHDHIVDVTSDNANVESVSTCTRLPTIGSLLQNASVLRALTTYCSSPLTTAHIIASYAPLLGLAKDALNPNIVETHKANDIDEEHAKTFVKIRQDTTFHVHILGASTLEASVSHLAYWSLLPQALAQRSNVKMMPFVPLADVIEGHETEHFTSTDNKPELDFKIRLVFVGPELPSNIYNSDALKSTLVSPHLSVAFYRGTYDNYLQYVDTLNPYYVPDATLANMPSFIVEQMQAKIDLANQYNKQLTGFSFLDSLPHLVLGFQMGLTVKEYNWGDSFKSFRSIINTNRRNVWLRYQDKLQVLVDHNQDANDASVKTKFVEIDNMTYTNDQRYSSFNVYLMTTSSSQEECDRESRILTSHYGCKSVFSSMKNPMAALQILQSGTLANDVWYKNRYVSLFTAPDVF